MLKALRPVAAIATCVLVSLGSALVAGPAQARALDTPVSTTTAAPSSTSTPAPGGSTVTPGPSKFSLTVTPTRLVVAASDLPHTQRVQVVNGGRSPVHVTVQKRNFTARPDGTLAFQEDAPYAAGTWLTLDHPTFDLAPGGTQTIEAKITVPTRPEPGDHQVALVFLVPAGKTAANVRINRGIAIPTFITVPGKTNDSAAVTALDGPGFVSGGPVTITAKVRDTGTVHRDFRDANPLRLEAPGSADAFPDFTVTRGSTRAVTTSWDPPLACICHPKVTILNADGTTGSRTIRVIVFPIRLALGALLGMVLLVVGWRLKRRRFHAHVASAAAALQRRDAPVDA